MCLKRIFSARIARVTDPDAGGEISRIHLGDVEINISHAILYDAMKFNSQNEWVKRWVSLCKLASLSNALFVRTVIS